MAASTRSSSAGVAYLISRVPAPPRSFSSTRVPSLRCSFSVRWRRLADASPAPFLLSARRPRAQAAFAPPPPAPPAGDEHVVLPLPPHQDRLQDALLLDRLAQLDDMALVEVPARLPLVGPDLFDAELQHALALGGRAAGD